MRVLWFLVVFFTCYTLKAQDDIPFMPNDQFESKIDLAFKKRESGDPATYTFSDGRQPKITTDRPIAFLSINFKLLRAEGEVKVSINTGRSEKVSKIKVGSILKLQFGFIEDLKNKGEATEVILTFLNDAKKAIRKVMFKIDQDGSYFVNGEKRGKF